MALGDYPQDRNGIALMVPSTGEVIEVIPIFGLLEIKGWIFGGGWLTRGQRQRAWRYLGRKGKAPPICLAVEHDTWNIVVANVKGRH